MNKRVFNYCQLKGLLNKGIRIEEELGDVAVFPGKSTFYNIFKN